MPQPKKKKKNKDVIVKIEREITFIVSCENGNAGAMRIRTKGRAEEIEGWEEGAGREFIKV